MQTTNRPPRSDYRFGAFRLRLPDRILERDGERLTLTPKIVDTLLVLVDRPGDVVSKEELMRAVWPDVTVVESSLTRNMSVLRKALEEGVPEGTFIETIPRRGYRFVGAVTKEAVPSDPLPRRNESVAEPSPKPSRRSPVRVWAAAAAALAGVAVIWAMQRQPQRAAAAVEPYVRIGEHLLYKLAPAETLRAMDHFDRAIAANPRSSAAHAGLSIALLQLESLGVWVPKPPALSAEEAARKALELDPANSPAHYAMGMLHTFRNWDFSSAEAEFQRALQLAPASVQTRMGYALLKISLNRMAEAQQLAEEALRLDPASPPLGALYCRVFYFQRDYRRAESECRKVLDREPGYALAHYYLALALGSLGRVEEAGESFKASGLMPAVVEADHAWLSALRGEQGPARRVLDARRESIRQDKVDAVAKLLLAATLDRQDEAYEAIEAGLARRAPELLTLHVEPRLDSIRKDPRYPAVLRRIRLAQQKGSRGTHLASPALAALPL
jgi:DNA-binding winged helix-turn-helix (wHTH) protein/Flp pilus assembly protein TadD